MKRSCTYPLVIHNLSINVWWWYSHSHTKSLEYNIKRKTDRRLHTQRRQSTFLGLRRQRKTDRVQAKRLTLADRLSLFLSLALAACTHSHTVCLTLFSLRTPTLPISVHVEATPSLSRSRSLSREKPCFMHFLSLRLLVITLRKEWLYTLVCWLLPAGVGVIFSVFFGFTRYVSERAFNICVCVSFAGWRSELVVSLTISSSSLSLSSTHPNVSQLFSLETPNNQVCVR